MISSMGRAPSHGKMSRSKRPMILLACPGAHRRACFVSHSRATASKLSSPPRAAFAAFRAALGSMPAASCLRALSRLASGFLQSHRGVDAHGEGACASRCKR